MITDHQIRQMMPNAGARLDAHLPFINAAIEEGRINTPRRIAAFMAQLAHESGEYRYMEELADGWAYEGRADLGNTEPGDGQKYKGHGPIQITGRANHRAAGEALGLDLINNPTLLTLPAYGTRSAVWFWNSRNLSPLADCDWFKTITRRINGGFNGLSDRRQYWDRIRALLGLPYVDLDKEEFVIAEFQRAHGLFADGIAGPRTLRALAEA
jgi:predicted chitinase